MKIMKKRLSILLFRIFVTHKSQLIFVTVTIKEHPLECLVDMGAEASLLTYKVVDKLNLNYHDYRRPIHLTAGNTPLKVLGEATIILSITLRRKTIELKSPMILSS